MIAAMRIGTSLLLALFVHAGVAQQPALDEAAAREAVYRIVRHSGLVPNFVVQGGCPRGDGYGSLDYSIRSELPPLSYDREGLVGMASAGNHTEGTQFFITHSPALHLDGNYTIFARVVDGMDVVHQIQPGSKIESIIIQ